MKGITLGSSEVKMSQFADDLTAVVADDQSAETLLRIVEDFGAFSGLKLNRDKSQLMILGGGMGPRAIPNLGASGSSKESKS